MSRFSSRRLTPEDGVRFVEFEQNNREPFEHFNEPNPPGHYSEIGLEQAFDKLVVRQHPERFLTRVLTLAGSDHWVGKGSITVHRGGSGDFAVLVYQTDRLHWRQGAARALLEALILETIALDLPRVDALIAADNTVSLHLLRRAGFHVAGWSSPAALLRGQIDCLRLSRSLQTVVFAGLARADMHLPA